MCLFSLAKFARDLDQEISSQPCEAQFLQFVSTVPPELAQDLSGWPDVREFCQKEGLETGATDPLVRGLIVGFQGTGSGPWVTIVHFLFWETLAQIQNRYGKRDEPGVVFSQACWSLLQRLGLFDLKMRPERLGQKIKNDVWHDVRRNFRVEKTKHPRLLKDEEAEDLADRIPSRYPGHEIATQAIERQWAITRLKAMVHGGAISRPDFQILLGCHLYGRSIEEMAVHLGVSYGVAKKRRQRAVKKLQITAPHLSPEDPDSPLIPLERDSRKEACDAPELPLSRNRK